MVVELLEAIGRNPVLENIPPAGLPHRELREVLGLDVESRDISDAGCRDIPVPRDLRRVLLIEDGVEDRLLREPRRPPAQAAGADQLHLLRPGRPPQRHDLERTGPLARRAIRRTDCRAARLPLGLRPAGDEPGQGGDPLTPRTRVDGRVRDGAGSCGNGDDGDLVIRTGSGVSLRETMCYACYEVMAVSTITHRELRNNSASILRRVQAGETFEVTNNGEPVALLSPVGGERLALLRRRGAVTPRARIDFARLRRATGIASRDVLDDLRGER